MGLIVWFLFFASVAPMGQATNTSGGLGVGATQTTGVSTSNTQTNNNQTAVTGQPSAQKVFKIADGPVTGATFVQTLYPTTTLARYVLQENGHVLDQPLDVPGSLPRAISNTTIPATALAVWGATGEFLYLQYLDGSTVKTVSLGFSVATSSKSVTRPVEIQFLPNNITGLAVSPSGKQVAYLLSTASGSDGYVANAEGGNAKKLFSIGFSELILAWHAQNTLLLTTKSNAGAAGVVFSVDARGGGIVPLIYANGLTATADRSFSNIVYQALPSGSAARTSYVHNMAQGKESPLALDPIPEKCVWGNTATSTMYCAVPLQYADATFLDRWHIGAASSADSIISFTIPTNRAAALAVPGSADGGVSSDILELAVSPDEKYLLFVKKGDRSLWAVRLGQN
jgi:hypothetical protein